MLIARFTCWFSLSLALSAVGWGAPPADFPAGVVERNQLADARAVDYAFENVEIDKVEGWLKWAGIESPVELSGRVTGWVWVQRSPSGWFNFRDYRIEGELTAPDLKIDQWSVADATLRFGYFSDSWYVGRLNGRITPPAGAEVAGALESHVRLDTQAAPVLTLGGSLSAIDLKTLLAAFDVPFELENQQGQLTFDARAPLSGIRDLRTWDAMAGMKLRDVVVSGLATPLQLAANVVLRNGQWQLNETSLQSPEDRLSLTGSGSVETPWTYTLSASGRDVSLARLFRDSDWNRFTERLLGLFSVEARITGDARTGVQLALVEAESKTLQIVDAVLRDAALRGQYSEGKLEVDLRHVSIAGGVLSAVAAWDNAEQIAEGIPSQLTLNAHQVDLRQLPRSELIGNAGGILDAELWFRADRLEDAPIQWQGNLAAQVHDSIAYGRDLGDLQITLSKPQEEASVEATLELNHRASQLRSQMTLALETPVDAVLSDSRLLSYTARGQAKALEVAVPVLGGSASQPLEFTGEFAISGDPQTWLQTGYATISDAATQIAGQSVTLKSLELEFNADEYRLRRFTISDASGRISGAAILRRNAIGEHSLRLRGTEFKVAPYLNRFGPDYLRGLEGRLNFATDLTVDANEAVGLDGWRGTFDGEASQLKYRENPLGHFRVSARAKDEQLALRVAGDVLDASLSFEAEVPKNVPDLFNGEGVSHDSLRLSADLKGLQLKRLADVLASRRSAIAVDDTAMTDARRLPSQPSGNAKQLDLNRLWWPELVGEVDGLLDAELSLQGAKAEGAPIQWDGTFMARLHEAIAYGMALDEVQLKLIKPQADANAEATLELSHHASHLSSQMTLALETPKAAVLAHSQLQSYAAGGRAETFRIATPVLGSFANQPLQITGDFEVAGDSQVWLRQGNATITDASTQIAGRPVSLQSLTLEFNADEFRLRRFTLSDPSGRISGAAILRRNAVGEHLLRLRGTGVRVAPYWDQFAPDYLHGLAGDIDFSTDVTVAATPAEGLGLWNGTFDGEVTQLSFRENEMGRVQITARALEQRSLLHVAGEMLGSPVAIEADLSANVRELFSDDDASSEPLRFSADIKELQLKRLAAVILGRRRANQIEGTASLTASGQLLNRQLSLGGQARIPNFVNARQPVCRVVVVNFKWDDRHFLIEQASGMLAGGIANVAGDVTWQENGAPDGKFKFDVQGVELNRFVALLYPDQAGEFAGKISYRGQGRVTDGYHFDGAATAIDGLVFGIPLQQVRGNLSVALGPNGALRQVTTSRLTGIVLGGRFLGDIQVRGGPSIELDSVGRVDRGRVEQLSRALNFDHIVGRGFFKGNYAVQSKNLFALADLRGKIQIDFDDGDAQTIPILADLNRLIPLMQLASTEITGGTMHALIGQGELRIQDLLLNSEAFWVAANGDASLATGRLDLQGVLQTGGGIEAQASQQLTKQLATLIVPQAILIAQLDNLLRNRTIYFRVGGSTGHPVIQPKVAPTVARAFLERMRQQLLIAPVTAAGISVD